MVTNHSNINNNEFNRPGDSYKSDDFPFVSVVIPTLNVAKTVKRAIEAILEQNYPKNKMELIVVDGGSIDGTLEIIQKYPVKLIQQKKKYPGDSGARNMGAKIANGDIIATTDGDDEVDKNWLLNLVKGYDEPDVGAVVGSSLAVSDKENWHERVISEIRICQQKSDKVENIYDRKGFLKTDIDVGPNQSFRNDVFNKIGGYDMGLSSGMDLDIIWRVEKAKLKVKFAHKAIVFKKSRTNFKDYLKQVYIRNRQGVPIYCKHPSKITLSYIYRAFFSISLISILLLSFLNIKLLLFLSILILIWPLIYYSQGLIKTKHILKYWPDIFFIFLLGYAGVLVNAISIPLGFYDYLYRYKENLLNSR